MKCPKCNFENRGIAKFCKKCGEKLELACPNCGFTCDPDSLFCDQCGQDLEESRESPSIDYSQPQSYTPKYLVDKILTTRSSIEGERKIVTVLFADVANYTSIAEKLDPEEVHQIMDGCFKILMDEIHRYEGTINQFTGDGVMALFGAPVAHEDHAQRACHAALAIQRAVGAYGKRVREDRGVDFEMRVGLDSGPVIVGTIGDDLKMDYTAIGDTTNLASRMETMARPGSVLVSGNTHKLARDYFEFTSLGKVTVKGKQKPQDTYGLVRPTDVETRIEVAAAKGLTRFVGRRREMEILREAFQKARSGWGQILGIRGDAGVGKSRLLREFQTSLPAGQHTFLQGSCLHYGRSIVYLPLLDILKSLFGIQDGEQEEDVQAKVKERVSQLDEKLLAAHAPLQDVLSLTIEDKTYPQIDAQQKRQRIFEAVRSLLIRVSQERPLVLVMEDLHWVDKSSQDFLDFFADSVPDSPILQILLYRPEYSRSQGSRLCCNEIALDQLSAKTSSELVQAILEEGEVVTELRELILGRAGGNPLFVEEVTQSLLENGSIDLEDDHYVLAGRPSEIEVPDTIQGIIAARMDRLDDSLKSIMQVASVIGREFAYRILATLTGMREDLKASLANLQGLEFIYEKQLYPELEYIFKHALTQEVAYNSLLSKRRRELHERIGQTIEQVYAERLEEYYELLAYHYGYSDNKAKTLEYLDLANQKAVSVYSLEEAKGHFDMAMELLDTLPETRENVERRTSLLANQYFVFMDLNKMTEWHDLLTKHEPLLPRIETPGLLGTFYSRLGFCEFGFGYFDNSIKTLSRAAELCEAAGNVKEAAKAYAALLGSLRILGYYDRVLTLGVDILRTMDKQFDLWAYMVALIHLMGTYVALGRFAEAVEEGQKMLDVGQQLSDNMCITAAAGMMSVAYTSKGDLGKALEYGELAVEKAPTMRIRAVAQSFLAWAWCRAGEPQRGLEVLVPFVQLTRSAGYTFGEIDGLLMLAEGYLLAGEYEEARQTWEELLKLATRCRARPYVGLAHRGLGMVSLEISPDDAASHFHKSRALLKEIKDENILAFANSGMGR